MFRGTEKNVSQDSLSPGGDTTPKPSKYKGVPITAPQGLVRPSIIKVCRSSLSPIAILVLVFRMAAFEASLPLIVSYLIRTTCHFHSTPPKLRGSECNIVLLNGQENVAVRKSAHISISTMHFHFLRGGWHAPCSSNAMRCSDFVYATDSRLVCLLNLTPYPWLL
jgi:hypothetical protein